MTICKWCERETASEMSCTLDVLHVVAQPVPMIPFGSEPDQPVPSVRCEGCGVARGAWHHIGCHVQGCPLCGGYLLTCRCDYDEDDVLKPPLPEDLWPTTGPGDLGVDRNGCLTETKWIGGMEVVVHYDDVPASDITELHGIRCTTALRTLIDISAGLERDDIRVNLDDLVARGLFTLADARRRLAEPDMAVHPGAAALRSVIEHG